MDSPPGPLSLTRLYTLLSCRLTAVVSLRAAPNASAERLAAYQVRLIDRAIAEMPWGVA